MSRSTTFRLTCLGLLLLGLAIPYDQVNADEILYVNLDSAVSDDVHAENRTGQNTLIRPHSSSNGKHQTLTQINMEPHKAHLALLLTAEEESLLKQTLLTKQSLKNDHEAINATLVGMSDAEVFGVGPIFDGIESPLRTLNLKKFEGSWYEIASTKKINAPTCLCATQSYKVESPSEIKVLTSCRKNIPDADEVNVGRAVVKDPYVPGAWAVSFGQPTAFTNFFVVELDPDYQIAVVTGINGLPVVVLSRSPEIPVEKLASIRGVLANQGYDLKLFSETIQQGCWSSPGFRR